MSCEEALSVILCCAVYQFYTAIETVNLI